MRRCRWRDGLGFGTDIGGQDAPGGSVHAHRCFPIVASGSRLITPFACLVPNPVAGRHQGSLCLGTVATPSGMSRCLLVPQGTPGEITDCQRFFAEPQHPISASTRRYDATSSRHVPPVRSPSSSAVPRGRSACCADTSVARTTAPSPGRSSARRLECACRRD